MWTPGPMELILLFGIVILLFGGKKIPGIAKGLGKGIRDFQMAKKGLSTGEEANQLKQGKVQQH